MSLISRSDRGLLARWWFTVDKPLLSATLLLMAVGVLVSMASSPPVAARIGLDPYHFVKSQLFYLSLAVVGLVTLSAFDRIWVRRAGLAGFAGSLVLMWLALKFGPEIKGAHRWIDIGPISLQPSEFAKPTFVIVFAWMLSERIRYPDMPGHLIAYGCAGLLLLSLIIQPDFGQAALGGCDHWCHVAGLWHSMACDFWTWVVQVVLLSPCPMHWFHTWLPVSTGFSIRRRAIHSRSIRRCRPSTMVAFWAPVPVAAQPSLFCLTPIRISLSLSWGRVWIAGVSCHHGVVPLHHHSCIEACEDGAGPVCGTRHGRSHVDVRHPGLNQHGCECCAVASQGHDASDDFLWGVIVAGNSHGDWLHSGTRAAGPLKYCHYSRC